MIRRYNYTGRKKVLAQKVKIGESIFNNIKTFSASLDLKDLGFPDEAKVYIEPYFNQTFLRFDFGTVARIQVPDSTDISNLPTTDRLRYRVKIVDETTTTGLILGAATIDGTLADDLSNNKKSLLPIDFRELGNRIWTLDFQEDGPMLAINVRLTNNRERIKKDDNFISLVYPEVIKRIAYKIASADDFFENGDEISGWEANWLIFFRTILRQTDMPVSSDDKDIGDWCDDIAEAFAKQNNIFTLFEQINHYGNKDI